jgi:hypothetical protein
MNKKRDLSSFLAVPPMRLHTSSSVPHNSLPGAHFLQSQEQHLFFSGFYRSLADPRRMATDRSLLSAACL